MAPAKKPAESPFGTGPFAPLTQFPAPSPEIAPPPKALLKPAVGVKPVTPGPTGKPVPVLTDFGFWGSIDQFGRRAQTVFDAHRNKTGLSPTPQQVLSLATDTELPDHELARFPYKSPDPQVAAAQDAVAQFPLTPDRQRYQGLRTTHPWVGEGALPLPPQLLHSFAESLGTVEKSKEELKPLLIGGMTEQEYAKMQSAANAATLGTYGAEVAATRQVHAVQTVAQAQAYLKNLAPEYFGDLPATGNINSDWASAIGKYQTTPAYFRQQTERIARDEGFGSNTAGFTKAWKAKEAAIHLHPEYHQFLTATPVAAFGANGHVNWSALAHKIGGEPELSVEGVVGAPFHTLASTAGLAFGELGGAISNVVADTAAVSSYLQAISPVEPIRVKGVPVPFTAQVNKHKLTEDEARERAFKLMTEDHPRVIQIVDPENKGGIVSDLATVAFDVAIGLPKLTGERLVAGDIAGFQTSRYASAKTNWAYEALSRGDLGQAVKTLGPGRGSEQVNAALEAGVKDGTISLAQYQRHVAELFADGHTMLADGTELTNAAGILHELRTTGLPARTVVGRNAGYVRYRVSKLTDAMEQQLRTSKQGGLTTNAADFIANVRQTTARATQNVGDFYADAHLPTDVYNWARINLKDIPLARELRDDAIRLRAGEDTAGLVELNTRMRDLFTAAHPKTEMPESPLESAGAQLESEYRSRLYFPQALDDVAAKINKELNDLGRVHREIIISGAVPVPFPPYGIPGGGESLAWKHAIDDTGRRILGGGGVWNKGVTPDLKAAKAEVDAHLTANPEAVRLLGTSRAQTIVGENRYINGYRNEDNENFRTGDALSDTNPKLRFEHTASMDAAGGYLRNTLASDGLRAFQKSSPNDLSALVKVVFSNKRWQSLAFDNPEFKKQLEEIKAAVGTQTPLAGIQSAIDAAKTAQAQAYAEMVYKRYKEIEDAGHAAGVADPLNEGLNVLIKNLGPKADRALGKWIAENKINMPVRDGLVQRSAWDDPMQRWIGVLMTANKWNRGVIFDHVFYSTVKELRGAGWTMDEAMPVAADLAKSQTIYHMLDFSNMLQVEQDLRWLSYFATKHRLYWTWILKLGRQRPGLAAAVTDMQNHLDDRGNINFEVAGHTFTVPVARLLWLNANGYPQTSPIVQFLEQTGIGLATGKGVSAPGLALNTLSSTSGNLISRQDQWLIMLTKWAAVSTGAMPSTSSAVTAFMAPTQARYFQMSVNSYAAFYKQQHGEWPSEEAAVKFALTHSVAQEAWRANLPLPFTFGDPTMRDDKSRKELDGYLKIVDPKKRRDYLDQHPGLALRFGVAQDPAVFLHVNILWDKFNAAHERLESERGKLYQQMLASGYTLDTRRKMSKLSKWWSATITALQLEDAGTWPGNKDFPAGKVSDGLVVQQGPWATQLEGDPLASRAFIHEAFPNVKASELTAHTVGEMVKQLRLEASRLNRADTEAKIKALGYPDAQHIRDRLSEINQTLAPFNGYPKDAASQAQSAYYEQYVSPYIKARDAKTDAAALVPAADQDAVRSALRAWKDEHDHPVEVTVNGKAIKFPSVVQIGWATLPEGTRRTALAQAVSGNWAHVASYEKTMLGVKTPPSVSAGWAKYAEAIGDYEKVPTNKPLVQAQKTSLAKQIGQDYPGFTRDYLFALQPKVERFERTSLYRTMPDKKWFDENVGAPAKATAAAIKANGSRTYYERHWRNYVRDELLPALERRPELKAELANYGPNFLNTLLSVGV